MKAPLIRCSALFVAFAVASSGCQCGKPELVPAMPFDAGYEDFYDAGVDAGPVTGGACDPGTRRCTATGVERCVDAGSGWVVDRSSYGCDFWAGVFAYLQNPFGMFGGNSYALTISNVGPVARVTITGGNLAQPMIFNVGTNDVSIIELTEKMPTKPFHIRSNQPISIVQFLPLHAESGGTKTHSVDSSLLRPTNSWSTRYLVASWNRFQSDPHSNLYLSPGAIGVVANVEDTKVTITTRADTLAGGGMPALTAEMPFIMNLDAGSLIDLRSTQGDLTGTLVESNKPIEVFGGHNGTYIPFNVSAADRLEEAMVPIDQLSTEYFVVAPAMPQIPNGRNQIVRIIAADDDIALTYEPPQLGARAHLAKLGDFVELGSSSSTYRVRATKKVMVAQYMLACQLASGLDDLGDPSMMTPLPPSQFSKRFAFHQPVDYTANHVDVVAPVGATVSLDGVALTGFTPIGLTGYGVYRVISVGPGPQRGGNHTVVASAPVSLSIYGYGSAVSYWHPGG